MLIPTQQHPVTRSVATLKRLTSDDGVDGHVGGPDQVERVCINGRSGEQAHLRGTGKVTADLAVHTERNLGSRVHRSRSSASARPRCRPIAASRVSATWSPRGQSARRPNSSFSPKCRSLPNSRSITQRVYRPPGHSPRRLAAMSPSRCCRRTDRLCHGPWRSLTRKIPSGKTRFLSIMEYTPPRPVRTTKGPSA